MQRLAARRDAHDVFVLSPTRHDLLYIGMQESFIKRMFNVIWCCCKVAGYRHSACLILLGTNNKAGICRLCYKALTCLLEISISAQRRYLGGNNHQLSVRRS